MTVRVNKQPFNIREKLSELERPIGVKGNELMGAETAQDARDFVSAGRKNLIINGELQIWQRGTSISATYSSRPYTADMFRIYNVNSGSGGTFSQSTDVPSNEFTYSLKRDTTGYNGHSEINIPIELNRTGSESPFVPGETYTFSYWVKGDGSDTSWINNVRARWSSSLTSGTYITTKLIKGYSGSGNWEKVIHEFTIDPAVPGTATYLSILIGRNNSHVGVNYWTGFQLEKGRNATEFEHRPRHEELALCQRYYQTINDSDSFGGSYWGSSANSGWQYSGSGGSCRIYFTTTMRAHPSATIVGTLSNNAGADGTIGAYGNAAWMSPTSITASETTPNSVRINLDGLSGSGKDAFGLYFYGTKFTSNVTLSAEL